MMCVKTKRIRAERSWRNGTEGYGIGWDHLCMWQQDSWDLLCLQVTTAKSNLCNIILYYIIYILCYINLDIHWLQIAVQGRFGFDFRPFFSFVHFNTKVTISKNIWPLHVFIFQSCWVCPGIYALFPGMSAQKNRQFFGQSKVRSAQKVPNTKLTTVVKKWPFPCPSQEIRPKVRNLARNLANGQLCVSLRRSRYNIYIYNYIYNNV